MTTGNDRSALILYGSETGTAQDLATDIGRLTERLHFFSRVTECNSVNVSDLLRYQVVLFVISTTGQGDLPANAQVFWRKLRSARLRSGSLSSVHFTSYGVGDSSYPKFNWAHRKLYNRVTQLGALPFCDRGESDEQHPEGIEGVYLPWAAQLRKSLLERFPLPTDLLPLADDVFLLPKWGVELQATGKDDPRQSQRIATDPVNHLQSSVKHESIAATVVGNKRVTPTKHWQDVRLFELATAPVEYKPGDVLTIMPKNLADSVELFIDIMNWKDIADSTIMFKPTFDSTDMANYPPPPVSVSSESILTLRQLLTDHIDLMAIPRRSFFASIAHFTEDEMQKERLLEFTQAEYIDELYDYTTRPRRSVIEILQEFHTVKIPLRWVASILPVIRGRQFSIASGGHLKYGPNNQGRIQILVAIVKYRTVIKKIREGLCTRYLASLAPGAKLNVTLSNSGFNVSLNSPAIMIGPGTGVAPLRSMIHERATLDPQSPFAQQQLLLFFGGRNRSADFFFEDEWQGLFSELPLTVFPAFSRDQESKVYVQDLIRQHSSTVYPLLGDGIIYVCGSSGKMPQAVREALIDVLQKEGKLAPVDAEAYFINMEKSGRYQQETW